MDSSDLSHTRSNSTEWQMLGELTLSDESTVDEQISAWLTQLLRPLSLYPEFLNRIIHSAQEATTRVLHPDLKLDHVHLTIFGPRDTVSIRQTWGFFQVEKVKQANMADTSALHAVEFYLYAESPESIEPSR